MNHRHPNVLRNAGLALAIACIALPAQAQLGGLLGKKSTPAAGTSEAPTGDALVDTFTNSQGLVIKAQTSFAEALGLKDRVGQLQAEQKVLSSGQMDTDALKKTRTLSAETQSAIDAKIAEQPKLSAESKATFSKGLVEYFKAVAGSKTLVSQAQAYTKSAGSNPMGMMGKGRGALYVGKETPGYVKGLAGTSRSLLEYAKRNDIAAPANATAALDGL